MESYSTGKFNFYSPWNYQKATGVFFVQFEQVQQSHKLMDYLHRYMQLYNKNILIPSINILTEMLNFLIF